ncbi:cation:proton antiporter, partial [Thermococci archaeon]
MAAMVLLFISATLTMIRMLI